MIDVQKLIEQAEKIVNDDQVSFANAISLPVQDVVIEGIKFELRVVLTRNSNQSQEIINSN